MRIPLLGPLLVALTSCVSLAHAGLGCEADLELPGRSLEPAEAMFRQDPRWLGSDGADSTLLGGERVFWSFEDSFINPSGTAIRAGGLMVRNSVAVQTGRDPRTAKMDFHWGRTEAGEPADFFAAPPGGWYWTGGALRLEEGPLIVFLRHMHSTPGEGLGFDELGHALAVIDNPDQGPEQWRVRIHEGPSYPFDATPATALVRQGGHVIGLALGDEGSHPGRLVRFRASRLASGDLGAAEWWGGDQVGWRRAADFGAGGPAVVIDGSGSEGSLHFSDRLGRWVHVTTYGFGDAWIGTRTAPALTGPWSAPRQIYAPPERCLDRPFIYGAFAHPELVAPRPGEWLITYATNSFEFAELLVSPGAKKLYWPRVIAVDFEAIGF